MFKRFCASLLVLLLVFSLAACGADSGETPEEAVTNALTAMKNQDYETAARYFSDDGRLLDDTDLIASDEEEMTQLLFDRFDFSIVSSTIDGDTATVKTQITNIDMVELFGNLFMQLMEQIFSDMFSEDPITEEEMDEMLEDIMIDLLVSEDTELLTTTIDIELVRTESSWQLQMDEDLLDAIFGGLLSAVEEMGAFDDWD